MKTYVLNFFFFLSNIIRKHKNKLQKQGAHLNFIDSNAQTLVPLFVECNALRLVALFINNNALFVKSNVQRLVQLLIECNTLRKVPLFINSNALRLVLLFRMQCSKTSSIIYKQQFPKASVLI